MILNPDPASCPVQTDSGRPERRKVADQIQQAFAVLPDAPAESLAPDGIGIKAFRMRSLYR